MATAYQQERQHDGPHDGRHVEGQHLDRHHLGMLLFISSEAIFFAALIITYVSHRTGSGAEASLLLDIPRIALFSLALLSSSGTVALAGRRIQRGDAGGARLWLLATIVLGAIFLAGQAWEYAELLGHGVGLRAGIFPSAFFTLTGFHGLHVLVGLIALVVLMAVADRRHVATHGTVAFEPISLYWHFVDAVWVIIFALVYLWKPL
jgi:heme/copper-type cytochrome/quinol oxidase subunit 3